MKKPIIVKGLGCDELPYKVYRVKSPEMMVLKRPKTKVGAPKGSPGGRDFFIDTAPPFAAFLYLDQAILFGNMLYPDNFIIVDESPFVDYHSRQECGNYQKLWNAMNNLGDDEELIDFDVDP